MLRLYRIALFFVASIPIAMLFKAIKSKRCRSINKVTVISPIRLRLVRQRQIQTMSLMSSCQLKNARIHPCMALSRGSSPIIITVYCQSDGHIAVRS